MDLRVALQQYFSYPDYREGQFEAVEAVCAGKNVCVVMPTGGGKSVCFQIPALVSPNYSLVISPLISLMKDQVDALLERGIPAAYINSTQTQPEQEKIIQQVREGKIKILYVAPERLKVRTFRVLIKEFIPDRLIIDEAHCISQWGHDFRVDYTRIGEFAQDLGIKQICAFTATATPQVQEDIVKQLRLPEMEMLISGFARPNLHITVQTADSAQRKVSALKKILAKQEPTLIYCATRKAVEELGEGLGVRMYHGGMSDKDREAAQNYFTQDACPVLAATNAFGMGIDRADIRNVIHYNVPGSVEAYYQEIGRAGRDGKPSRCVLFFAFSDRYIHEFLIDMSCPDAALVRSTWKALRQIAQHFETNYIEMTLEQLSEQVPNAKGGQQMSAVLNILEKSQFIRRGFRSQNKGRLQLTVSQEELYEFLSGRKTQRSVTMGRLLEHYGEETLRRGVALSFTDLEQLTGFNNAQIRRVMPAIQDLYVEWQAPFSGRAIEILESKDEVDNIDFKALEEKKSNDYEHLAKIFRFAKSKSCRQDFLLKYFGEKRKKFRCGHCDNCRGAQAEHDRMPSEDERDFDVDTIQTLLKAVTKHEGYIGRFKLAELLHGTLDEGAGWLFNSPYYGVLAKMKKAELLDLVRHCLKEKYIEQSEGKFPTLSATNLGEEFLRYPQTVLRKKEAKPKPRDLGDLDLTEGDVDREVGLYDALRQLRMKLAAAQGMEAYMVFSNETLRLLAVKKPKDMKSLQEIKGIGAYRAKTFGPAFISIIKNF